MGIFCSWALCTPVQKCRYGDSNVDIIARLGGGQAEGEPGRAGERGGAAAVQVSPYSTVQYTEEEREMYRGIQAGFDRG